MRTRSTAAVLVTALALAFIAVVGVRPATASPSQYQPGPPPSTVPGVVVVPTSTPAPRGPQSSLATTGADSSELAGKGAALVLVGFGLILLRRRYRERH